MVTVKRAYESASPDDGYRILTDRLWPRGVSREKAKLDVWMKDIAPSDGLRKWFGHSPDKWVEFKKRYLAELKACPDAVAELRNAVNGHDTVSLVYGAKDEAHNEAVALREFLASGKL